MDLNYLYSIKTFFSVQPNELRFLDSLHLFIWF